MVNLHNSISLGLGLCVSFFALGASAQGAPPTGSGTVPTAAAKPAAKPAAGAAVVDEATGKSAVADPPTGTGNVAPGEATGQKPTAASATESGTTAPDVAPPSSARLIHAPRAVAKPHEDFVIEASISSPDRVRRALLVYRATGGEIREVEFRRGGESYAAFIPAADVQAPGIAYAIELELVGDARVSVFATRQNLHSVLVPEDIADVRERAQLKRLDGRRSVISAGGEWVSFGKTDVPEFDRSVNDGYWRLDAGYTYRPLRTVNEFGVNFGLVRGTSPVQGASNFDGTTGEYDPDVGLNYARPRVRFRLADAWHLEPSLVVSVTEVGFAMGAGVELHVGDPYGAKLVLGAEGISLFGTKVFSRVDLVASDAVTVSPIIEVTDTPNADRFGVRLLGELKVDGGGGFGVLARGGYQARDAASGGPSGGGHLSYAF